MLTRWPVLRCTKRGSASFIPNITPWTLMSTCRRVVLSSSSRNSPSCMIPALLTSTSSGPSFSSTPSRKAAKDSRRVTSSSNGSTPAPSSTAVCSAAARSRSPMPTFMPWRTKAWAVARPIPRAPPVMAATRPVRIRACLAMSRTVSWRPVSSGVLVAVFLVSAGAIWVSGAALAGTVDTLDGRFGLGADVGGAVILGIITNLPEIAIVVSAAAGGALALATGNILGGIAIQTVVLALLDQRSPTDQPLSASASSLVLALEALTVVGVVTFAVMGTQLDPDVNVAGLSPMSVAIAATWIAGLVVVRRTQRRPGWNAEPTTAAAPGRRMRSHPKHEPVDHYGDRATRYVVGITVIAALVTLGAGVAIERSGNELAQRAGIQGAVFGATFLAAATALPEVSTGLTAVRVGHHQLAVSDILGGNAFLPVLFVVADLVSGTPALPAAHSTDLWLAALGVVVSAVYAVGFITRPRRDRWGMGLDSRLV